jgi:hypothetical protein
MKTNNSVSFGKPEEIFTYTIDFEEKKLEIFR